MSQSVPTRNSYKRRPNHGSSSFGGTSCFSLLVVTAALGIITSITNRPIFPVASSFPTTQRTTATKTMTRSHTINIRLPMMTTLYSFPPSSPSPFDNNEFSGMNREEEEERRNRFTADSIASFQSKSFQPGMDRMDNPFSNRNDPSSVGRGPPSPPESSSSSLSSSSPNSSASPSLPVGEVIRNARSSEALLDAAFDLWLPTDRDLPTNLRRVSTQSQYEEEHDRRQQCASQLLYKLGSTLANAHANAVKQHAKSSMPSFSSIWNDVRLERAILAVALPFYVPHTATRTAVEGDLNAKITARLQREGGYISAAMVGLQAISNAELTHFDLHPSDGTWEGIMMLLERARDERLINTISLRQVETMRWAAQSLLEQMSRSREGEFRVSERVGDLLHLLDARLSSKNPPPVQSNEYMQNERGRPQPNEFMQNQRGRPQPDDIMQNRRGRPQPNEFMQSDRGRPQPNDFMQNDRGRPQSNDFMQSERGGFSQGDDSREMMNRIRDQQFRYSGGEGRMKTPRTQSNDRLDSLMKQMEDRVSRLSSEDGIKRPFVQGGHGATFDRMEEIPETKIPEYREDNGDNGDKQKQRIQDDNRLSALMKQMEDRVSRLPFSDKEDEEFEKEIAQVQQEEREALVGQTDATENDDDQPVFEMPIKDPLGELKRVSQDMQMQPPRQQMEPPRQQMEPPRQQMQPPRQQMEPPRQQMQPPRQQMEPPRQQMEPPRQPMEPPRQQMDNRVSGMAPGQKGVNENAKRNESTRAPSERGASLNQRDAGPVSKGPVPDPKKKERKSLAQDRLGALMKEREKRVSKSSPDKEKAGRPPMQNARSASLDPAFMTEQEKARLARDREEAAQKQSGDSKPAEPGNHPYVQKRLDALLKQMKSQGSGVQDVGAEEASEFPGRFGNIMKDPGSGPTQIDDLQATLASEYNENSDAPYFTQDRFGSLMSQFGPTVPADEDPGEVKEQAAERRFDIPRNQMLDRIRKKAPEQKKKIENDTTNFQDKFVDLPLLSADDPSDFLFKGNYEETEKDKSNDRFSSLLNRVSTGSLKEEKVVEKAKEESNREEIPPRAQRMVEDRRVEASPVQEGTIAPVKRQGDRVVEVSSQIEKGHDDMSFEDKLDDLPSISEDGLSDAPYRMGEENERNPSHQKFGSLVNQYEERVPQSFVEDKEKLDSSSLKGSLDSSPKRPDDRVSQVPSGKGMEENYSDKTRAENKFVDLPELSEDGLSDVPFDTKEVDERKSIHKRFESLVDIDKGAVPESLEYEEKKSDSSGVKGSFDSGSVKRPDDRVSKVLPVEDREETEDDTTRLENKFVDLPELSEDGLSDVPFDTKETDERKSVHKRFESLVGKDREPVPKSLEDGEKKSDSSKAQGILDSSLQQSEDQAPGVPVKEKEVKGDKTLAKDKLVHLPELSEDGLSDAPFATTEENERIPAHKGFGSLVGKQKRRDPKSLEGNEKKKDTSRAEGSLDGSQKRPDDQVPQVPVQGDDDKTRVKDKFVDLPELTEDGLSDVPFETKEGDKKKPAGHNKFGSLVGKYMDKKKSDSSEVKGSVASPDHRVSQAPPGKDEKETADETEAKDKFVELPELSEDGLSDVPFDMKEEDERKPIHDRFDTLVDQLHGGADKKKTEQDQEDDVSNRLDEPDPESSVDEDEKAPTDKENFEDTLMQFMEFFDVVSKLPEEDGKEKSDKTPSAQENFDASLVRFLDVVSRLKFEDVENKKETTTPPPYQFGLDAPADPHYDVVSKFPYGVDDKSLAHGRFDRLLNRLTDGLSELPVDEWDKKQNN